MTEVLEEVTRVMNLYIDGAGNGNSDQMNEAFHSSAHWFGAMDGVDYDMDKEGFVALMVETPGHPSMSEIPITLYPKPEHLQFSSEPKQVFSPIRQCARTKGAPSNSTPPPRIYSAVVTVRYLIPSMAQR